MKPDKQEVDTYYNMISDLGELVEEHTHIRLVKAVSDAIVEEIRIESMLANPMSPTTSTAIDDAYNHYKMLQDRDNSESSYDSDEGYSFYEKYSYRDSAELKKSKEKQPELG